MARRMHSRSLLFFEKELNLNAHLIVENFKSYNSIILNTTGGDHQESALYIEIPIIRGNEINIYHSADWELVALSVGDKLELSFYQDAINVVNGLVIWGVK